MKRIPKSIRTKLKLIVALLFTIGLLFTVLYVNSDSSHSEETLVTESEADKPPDGWQKYTDTIHNISLYHPADLPVAAGPTSDDKQDHVYEISVGPRPGHLTGWFGVNVYEETVSGLITQLRNRYSTYELNVVDEDIERFGESNITKIEFKNSETEQIISYYLVYRNNYTYLVSGEIDNDSQSKNLPEHNQIVSSLVFE